MIFFEPKRQALASGALLFERFTWPHLVYLALCAAMIVGSLWALRGRSAQAKERFLLLLCWILPISQALRIAWEVYAGIFTWTYSLPFQVCSSMSIIALLYVITRNTKFLDYVFIVGTSLGTAALVFATLNGSYPVFYYYTWQYFFHHALFVLIGLVHVFSCGHHPRVRTAWFSVVVMVVLIALDSTLNYVINRLLGRPKIGPDSANYGWISFGAEGTPLAWIERGFGTQFYLLGVCLCAAALFILMYLPFAIAEHRRNVGPALAPTGARL